jgi:hypothetical protein
MALKEKAARAGTRTASDTTFGSPHYSTHGGIDNLLSRLDRVKQTKADSWMACCPAHKDRAPSLSIRYIDDKTLIHCFAGCSVLEVVSAIGMEISDLFPPRESHGKPVRRPFPAMDALRGIAFEALVVSAAASALLAGHPFTQADRERLSLATSRIQSALSAAMPQLRGARHD